MRKDRIEIELILNDHKWGQIIDDGEATLVGMYECGEVARQLFTLDREKLKQLVNTLYLMIH